MLFCLNLTEFKGNYLLVKLTWGFNFSDNYILELRTELQTSEALLKKLEDKSLAQTRQLEQLKSMDNKINGYETSYHVVCIKLFDWLKRCLARSEMAATLLKIVM